MVGLALLRRSGTVIVASLLLCAAVAWFFTIRESASMAMDVAMMNAGLFLGTWVVMMVAMMFPSVAPITLAFASVSRSRGDRSLPTAVFVLGYLSVWAAAGLVPLSVLEAITLLGGTPPSWLGRAGGAVIVLAGIYQLTPLKSVCLRACRSPIVFVMTHDFGSGAVSAARAGASHGLYCLGCCWALMAVMAVLGLMNSAWMAVMAAVIFIEKNVRFGGALSTVVGVVTVVGGFVLIAA